jgi:RNA polymerase sigma-70 factor (ECF subfamily)
MSAADTPTDELLRPAGLGGEGVRTGLLARHRDRLRRMVAVRIDRRPAARAAPSDEVREALADASAQILPAANLAAGGSTPIRAVNREEMLDRVHHALARLDPRDREVLVMRHLEGLSSAEVGSVLLLSEGAVRARLVRALKRLRVLLEQYNDDAREGRP